MSRRVIIRGLSSLAVHAAMLWSACCPAADTAGFGPLVKYGDPVPRDVRDMYDAGVRYLVKTQQPSGYLGGGGGSKSSLASSRRSSWSSTLAGYLSLLRNLW